MEAREGWDAIGRLDATHDSAARPCRETQRNFSQKVELTHAKHQACIDRMPLPVMANTCSHRALA